MQALQSFSTNTGTPKCFSRAFCRGAFFHWRFGAKITSPDSGLIAPGAPIPTPRTCLSERSASSTASRTHRATRSTTDSKPREALVLNLTVWSNRSWGVNIPAKILVPPRSTPTMTSCLMVSVMRFPTPSGWQPRLWSKENMVTFHPDVARSPAPPEGVRRCKTSFSGPYA